MTYILLWIFPFLWENTWNGYKNPNHICHIYFMLGEILSLAFIIFLIEWVKFYFEVWKIFVDFKHWLLAHELSWRWQFWSKSLHCKNVGQTITQRWFNYEQPNFWVNNCQSWLKCWLISKLLDKIFDQLPNCWVTFHQQLVIIIYPTTGLFIVDPTLKYCPTF